MSRTSVASSGVYSFDRHFLWNQFMISGLLEYKSKLDRKKQMDLDRGGFLVNHPYDYLYVYRIIMIRVGVCNKRICWSRNNKIRSRKIRTISYF